MLVSLDEILAAVPRVAALARRTPVLDAGVIDGRPLFLKCENMQPSGAFKIRGAANMVHQLGAEERRRGIITYSSGNHGQAVALAAHSVGSPAVIVMPTTAPAIKVAGVQRYGAEVIFEGTTSVERHARAECEAQRRGLTMVPPFDHRWIIAGQGTAGLEILEQLPQASLVVVPIGGGGLASGVAAAVKLSRPDVSVLGVEPEGANSMQQSLRAGAPMTVASSQSIADGLLPVRPGDLTFAHAKAFVDAVVTVPDSAIVAALRWLYFEARLVVEPSGATALAAVLACAARPYVPASGAVVAVLSGGNIAPAQLAAILQDDNAGLPT